MTEEKRRYYGTRKLYAPEKGRIYENESGGLYRCERWDPYTKTAVMQNVNSSWTFTAHGIGIYIDEKIDWDYSTDGYFMRREIFADHA